MTVEDEKAKSDASTYSNLPIGDADLHRDKLKGNINLRERNYKFSKNIMDSTSLALKNDNAVANNIYKDTIITFSEESPGDLKEYNNKSGYVTNDGYWRMLNIKRLSSYRWISGRTPQILKLRGNFYKAGEFVDDKTTGEKVSILFPTMYIKAQNRRIASKLYIGQSLIPYKISDLYNKNVLITTTGNRKKTGSYMIGCVENEGKPDSMIRHDFFGKTRNLSDCKKLADDTGHAFYSLSGVNKNGVGYCNTGNTYNNWRPNQQNFPGEEKFNLGKKWVNNTIGELKGATAKGCYKDKPGREMLWLQPGRWWSWEDCRNAANRIPGATHFALQYAVNNQKGQCFYSREKNLTGRLDRQGKRLTNGRAPWASSCHGYSCGGKSGYVCPPGRPGSIGRWWCCSRGRWVSNLSDCRKNLDNCFYNRRSKSGYIVNHGSGWSNYIYKLDPIKYRCQPYKKNTAAAGIIGKLIGSWWGSVSTVYKGKKIGGKSYDAVYYNPTTWQGNYKTNVGKSGYIDKNGTLHDTTKYQRYGNTYTLNSSNELPTIDMRQIRTILTRQTWSKSDLNACKKKCNNNNTCTGVIMASGRCFTVNEKGYNNIKEQGSKTTMGDTRNLRDNVQWYQRDIVVNTGNPNCTQTRFNSNTNGQGYTLLENNKLYNLPMGGDVRKLDCTNKKFIEKIKEKDAEANRINRQQSAIGRRDVNIIDKSMQKVDLKIKTGNNLGESSAVSTDKNIKALSQVKGKNAEGFTIKEGLNNENKYRLVNELGNTPADGVYYNNIMKLIGNDNKILDVKHKDELTHRYYNRHAGYDERTTRYHNYFIIKYKKGTYPIPFAKLPDGTHVWYYSSFRTKGDVTDALKKITEQQFFEDSVRRMKKNFLFNKSNIGEVSYVNYNPTGTLTNTIAKQNYWLTNGYKSVINAHPSNLPQMPLFNNSKIGPACIGEATGAADNP